MNHVLRNFIGKFVVVYFDDILLYNKTLYSQMGHVKGVLEVLRREKLYANKEKMHFCTHEVIFLGFVVSSKEFVIYSDHESLKYLKSLGKLNKRHVGWI